MEVTRRYEVGVVLGCLLAGGALLFDQLLLLVGAAGIGASLLVRQYRFTRDVLATADALTVTQSMSQRRVATDEDTSVAVSATLSEPSPLAVAVEPRPPMTATERDPENQSFTLAAGERDATTTFSLRWPVAGKFECEPPTVTLTDPAGLFRSAVPMGDAESVTVAPRRPRALHVGMGGESMSTAFGEHKTGDRGVGLDPAEIRQYVPGDTMRQIDWKATARMNTPHVREFDAETDLSTALVVDHRSSMTTGIEGETKLDYLRHVALAYADNARTNTEPLSLYTVGDAGVTTTRQPDASARHYTDIETRLHDLVSTAVENTTETDPTTNGPSGARAQTPREAREMATHLRSEDSAFGRTLLPYVVESERYVQRIEGDPLYKTVRTYLGGVRGSVMTVILTDDTHRMEVREAVRAARRRSEHVLVFLAPTVLFERGGVGTVESAYEGYVDFEEFRRDLTRIDGVTALEIAPADRIEAILAETRRAKEPAAGGR
ncbi:hypothetical protein ZOD2009_14681 [Haladaptatus paucihalophilus DX253]|uniref:DUF58 domain-containing protein n=1 Tax=Haladaptatus paucihalophilus DX253 TaxID=797209 RepID=E7QVV0_HALPU|nr:DUF58 domain-containing protein [Haladaptatus paucihalophilus]EFW91363.1 hypothetical protein ZOD2009_14681 [Haladaptatus paucihalophilus DX253]SHL11894.1 Protein of unknown function DUF58 [Haladaptatus paucihalophilus DX253]